MPLTGCYCTICAFTSFDEDHFPDVLYITRIHVDEVDTRHDLVVLLIPPIPGYCVLTGLLHGVNKGFQPDSRNS